MNRIRFTRQRGKGYAPTDFFRFQIHGHGHAQCIVISIIQPRLVLEKWILDRGLMVQCFGRTGLVANTPREIGVKILFRRGSHIRFSSRFSFRIGCRSSEKPAQYSSADQTVYQCRRRYCTRNDQTKK